jgi:hypothetical protein
VAATRTIIRLAAGAWDRKSVTYDRLADQLIGPGCEPEAEAKIDVKHAELEIRHSEQQLLLLLQRQEIADLAEVAVILRADVKIVPKLAGEPYGRRKICSP